MLNVRRCCGWSDLHQALTWHCSKETSCHASSAFSTQGVKVPGSCFPKPKSQSFPSNILQHFSFPTQGTVLLGCTHSIEITEMTPIFTTQPVSSSSPLEAHCRAILKPQFQRTQYNQRLTCSTLLQVSSKSQCDLFAFQIEVTF